MKEDVFTQTAQIKKIIVNVLHDIDEVQQKIHLYPELQEETQKLAEAKEMLNKTTFNLDEIEHLVIVSAVGRVED
ncbi:MAG: hypothetical protein V1726_06110 [Methanobacteriota archaeon]